MSVQLASPPGRTFGPLSRLFRLSRGLDFFPSYRQRQTGTRLAASLRMNAPSHPGHRLALHADASQRQTLSPRLQHAVRLLQLSSMEFTQELQTLQGRNPFLDFEDEDGPGAGSAESASADDGNSGSLDDDREPWLGEPARTTRQHESGDASALDFVPNVRSLAEHLHFQLSLLRLSQRDLVLAHAIVDSLDDDGYLRMELADLLSILRRAKTWTKAWTA